MLGELKRYYEQVEDARREVVRTVRRLAYGVLNHKPERDQWSILEELQHLVLAEQKTNLKMSTVTVSEDRNPEMLEMVLQVLDHDVVVEVPDPDMVPDGNVALDDLIHDWEESRKRLRRFLEACGPDDLQTPVSRHPVAGSLTVGECLRLIAAHLNHHRRRIEAAIDRG